MKLCYYIHFYFEKIKLYFQVNGIKILKYLLFQILFLALLIGLIAPISIYIYNNSPSKYLSSDIQFSNGNSGNDKYSPRTSNISIYDSKLFPNQWEDVNVLLDPHSHTIYSDGSLSPEENIKWHIANGYNVMFMTDHNRISGGLAGQKIALEKYSSQILVIPGIEWTNCRCHMNLIGLTEDVPLYKFPTDQQIKDTIDFVHSKGGLVILNHYPWSTWAGLDQPTMEQYYEWGIDFLEVVNIDTLDYQGIVFCKNHDLRYVSGSDFHYSQKAFAWTVLKINDPLQASGIPTQEQVLSTLSNKSTIVSFAFDAVSGDTIKVSTQNQAQNPTWIFISPWIYMGGFFHSFFELKKGMYSFVDGSCTPQIVDIHSKEIASLVTWVFILFFAAQLIYLIIIYFFKLLKKLYNRLRSSSSSSSSSSPSFSPKLESNDKEFNQFQIDDNSSISSDENNI